MCSIRTFYSENQCLSYREENLEEINARRRELWYRDHEKNLAAERARKEKRHLYYLATKGHREELRRARLKSDPASFQAIWARRYAAKKKALPKWANKEAMLVVYRLAKKMSDETGEPHEVDHIVPIQSKFVCGLHCEANLRVIPRSENKRKSNSYWPDMP